MKLVLTLSALFIVALLAGYKEDSAAITLPTPIELTEEAAGHYCQMVILDHQGPKGQVFLAGMDAPLWFSQVRDGLAYLKSPEKTDEIVVLYVNDMGKAENWTKPGADNWIKAEDAFFVVGSDAKGGMGAPEIAPFGTIEGANDFAAERGGNVMQLNDIPVEAVLGPIELARNEESSK